MKLTILSILFLFIFVNSAFADIFQFRQNSIPAANAAVYFNNNLVGYTNLEGVIQITTPQGENNFTIVYMGITTTVRLTISNNSNLRIVNIQ